MPKWCNLTLFNIIFHNTQVLHSLPIFICQPIANKLINCRLTRYNSQTDLDSAKYFRIFAFWEKSIVDGQ